MSIKCKICQKEPVANCDWMQGRCPHLPPLIKGKNMNHRNISFVKSGFRLGACFALACFEIQLAAILFAVAELLGIGEELV